METVTYPDPRVAVFIVGHSLGVGKYQLHRQHFVQAGERFDEVADPGNGRRCDPTPRSYIRRKPYPRSHL